MLQERHGQLGFHFLTLFLKHGKELGFSIFCGLKDKKDIVSASYPTVFEFLAYNSLFILKSYGIVTLTLKISPNMVGDVDVGHAGIYKFQLLDFGHLSMNYIGIILIKEFIARWFIVRINGHQYSLMNAIDFIIHCPRMEHPYQMTIIELWFYKCFH